MCWAPAAAAARDVRDGVDLSFFHFGPAKKFARSTSHKDVTVVRKVFLRKELVNDALIKAVMMLIFFYYSYVQRNY